MNQHQHPYDRLGGRRLCARRSPNDPYIMCRAPDASFAAMSLTDVFASVNALSDALAENADLFNLNGELVWLNQGKLTPVNMNTIHHIVPQHIATKELVNKGTRENPAWTVEYVPFIPDQRLVRDLFGTERREGSLLARVTKAWPDPTTPAAEPRRQQKIFTPPA